MEGDILKIAIVGELRSGKDTFANYYIERGFKNLHLVTQLKK